MINTAFRDEWLSNLQKNILAGLTTSFALVPECIAFALVAQLNPLMGLYGAVIICALTAIFGGRPGMISGAAGSMAVVIVALVAQHGVQYLLATVVLSGMLMALFGILRLGKLIRMVPHPVMLGFVNGLAIIIAMAQLEHFRVATPQGEQWLQGTPLYVMGALVALTMAIVYLLPRITRAVPQHWWPSLAWACSAIACTCPRAPWATWRISPAACRPCISPPYRWTWPPCTSSSRMRR